MVKIIAKIVAFFKSENFQSFVHTLVTDVLYDAGVAAAIGHALNDRDYSRQSIIIIGYALFRTVCRALVAWFKKRFPNKVVETSGESPAPSV